MREDRKEQLRSRCRSEWKKRDIEDEYAILPFTAEEVAHITLLNNHLLGLTREAMEKARRVDKDLRELIAHGREEYCSFHVDASIVVDLLDCQETLGDDFSRAIDASKPYWVVGLDEEDTEDEQSEYIRHQLSLSNEQDDPIGRRWMELWTRYHIALCMAFAWFFDDNDFFTPDDIMKLNPENFTVSVQVDM